jgi:hypothetical protein
VTIGPVGYHLWNDLGSNTTWLPGINRATCKRTPRHTTSAPDPESRIPVETCGCGYWLYRNFEDLVDGWAQPHLQMQVSGSAGLWGFSPADRAAVRAIGLVASGGKVIEGELGYRVAQARIVELYADTVVPLLAAVADRFGVAVKPYPWPTATGLVEIQDRPELPSRVILWTGEETLTFFEHPASVAYRQLRRADGLVKVVYRTSRVGRTQVATLMRVESF